MEGGEFGNPGLSSLPVRHQSELITGVVHWSHYVDIMKCIAMYGWHHWAMRSRHLLTSTMV